ncbi:Lrp/AsnC family transcriptional regulator [Desertihabitans aurantiacus]|uniref:Lrp/AsnC family transcriptional regulator n=1 Tax=Desertihabitans aurantiacus TaxID=2282477 RepID=UPI000DF82713|nr:Lrp/AsnC family transcriptional regulator [Desertihabitans aurantiacus]
MEKIDRQILSLLSGDGRMSYTDIGRATGLSTSAAQQRVRRLEQRGVIAGYTARINPEALGRTLTAFVEVTPLDPSQPDDIPERLAPISEVVSCYSIAGDANYLLKVQVGTPLELEHLLLRLRTTGNVTTHTTLVLSIPYEERPFEG